MNTPRPTSYGSWKSPITSDLIVTESLRLFEIALDGEEIYWVESRPSEGGRYVLVRSMPEGQVLDLIPTPFSARTRVHEYGGGAFVVNNGLVIFSNDSDGRLYRLEDNCPPRTITPEGSFRYADGVLDCRRGRSIWVREDHTDVGREPVNSLVSIDLEGKDEPRVLASGMDFYSSPRLSPDGNQLAWLTWNHPNMPWMGTELWAASIQEEGSLETPVRVAGGIDESIFQPEWSPDGVLYFISDRSGWWNLYRRQDDTIEAMAEMEAEFGQPQWVFGLSTYAFASRDRLICSLTQQGAWQLAEIDTLSKKLTSMDIPYTEIGYVRANSERVLFRGGSPTEPASIVQLELETGRTRTLRVSSVINEELRGYFSAPAPVEFPTSGGQKAYALFYPPRNPDYTAPPGEKPPLLVKSHGGPTSAASSSLNLNTQYWTSRGIAVLDVNYGGSTGYGREYQQRLKGEWGVVDVEDCVNAAGFLVEKGEVDGARLAITGGSAGGYTTLCALTFHQKFGAGASHFGVSDLEALAKDTHKFESRYLDFLIGPYPEAIELYRQRSPIHFVEQLSVPVAFFQGAEDRVVPPSQAELMVQALRAKGTPVVYFLFEQEQHGFRRAENIKRALDGELYFYATVLLGTSLRF